MPATPAQTALVERIRGLLADEPTTREVPMFGGLSFMVDEKLIVSAAKDGGLLVRVASSRHDELLEQPGATQAEMGAGRDMGPGWIMVAPSALADDHGLSFWVGLALDHQRTGDSPR